MKTFLPVVALLLAFAVPAIADPVDEPATAAAKAWLKLIDDKDYAAGWADAASLFKQGIDQQAWVKQVDEHRGTLGAVKSRKFLTFKETTSLPGVPDGDYAIVIFESAFENRAQSEEDMALVHEGKDWKVGGYYIR